MRSSFMLESNRQFGRYRIQSPIGAGGMGEVYLAEDTKLHRKVALKILPENIASDENRLQRFEQEAFAASALNHPNILTIYEFGVEEKTHFLAAEFVEGETLREKIKGGRLSLPDALGIAGQTAFALSAAHAARIVHRDIKPENIMIRRDGIVKVLDFGIAKLGTPTGGWVDTEADTLAKIMTQTKPGTIMGTLRYMSPEQVRGQALDARSDIFSLGVCLYEMLTGIEPFDKPTSSDVIAAILTEHPPPVTQNRPDAPAELQRIVGKTLKKNKDERYQTTKDLLLDIKSLEREIEFPALSKPATAGGETRLTEEQSIHVTSSAGRPQSPLALALFILLISGLTIGVIWWLIVKDNFANLAVQKFSPNTLEAASWKSSPGEIYNSASLSPDGRMIAFVSTQTGAKNVWVKQLSGGEPIQITKDDFINQYPIWSPDGSEIAFFSIRGGRAGIWRVPSFGGSPTFIKPVEDDSMILQSWSKKNVIYYEAKENLFALDIKSGQSSQLTNFDSAKAKPNSIIISPDEEQIAFLTVENEKYVVSTMAVRGGSIRPVLNLADEVRNVVWHPDNKRLLYSAMVGGIFQIFAAETSGNGNQTQITFGDRDAFALGVSVDGAKILYGSSKEEADVWGVNVEKEEEFPVASDIDSELWAAAAPDGKTIAFQSIKNLSQGDKIFSGAILTKQVNSDAQPFQLVANGFLPTWSPDGKQLAFVRVAGETYNLWAVSASGGQEKQLTTGGLPSVEFSVLPYNRKYVSYIGWSPDGKKIAYISAASGQRNVWLVEANGSGNAQLTENTDANLFLYCPLWSSDGEQIAYAAKSDKPLADNKRFYAVYVVDLQTKNTKTVIQSENFQKLIGWTAANKELILAATKEKDARGTPTEVSIIQINTETGGERELAKLDSAYLYNIYLSADKKLLAYVAKKDGKDNVWIMPLTGGGPRRLTSNNDPKLYFSNLSWSPDNRIIYFGKQTRYNLLSIVTNFK